MYLPPLSQLSCHCCNPRLVVCDPEGFSLWLDPVLHCLRDLCCWAQPPADLRNTGSVLSSANNSQPDLCQTSAPFKARLSDLRMSEIRHSLKYFFFISSNTKPL